MIGLLQRVSQASVTIKGECISQIGQGILVLVGVERGDDEAAVERLTNRLLGYRVFPDADGKMNLSVRDIHAGVLLVPQFTLAADTRKGMRASFTSAAPPDVGEALFSQLVKLVKSQHETVATGRFGADMQVALINDGPVTFCLQV